MNRPEPGRAVTLVGGVKIGGIGVNSLCMNSVEYMHIVCVHVRVSASTRPYFLHDLLKGQRSKQALAKSKPSTHSPRKAPSLEDRTDSRVWGGGGRDEPKCEEVLQYTVTRA